MSRALHIIAAVSQCGSPEEIIVRAELEMQRFITGTRAQISILVCEPKRGKRVKTSRGESEHILWGIDLKRKKKFIVSGSRPGLRGSLATRQVRIRKVPNLNPVTNDDSSEDDPDNEDKDAASSAVIYIPFVTTKLSKKRKKRRRRKKRPRRTGGGFDVDVSSVASSTDESDVGYTRWGLEQVNGEGSDASDEEEDDDDSGVELDPAGIIRITVPWAERRKIDVPAVRMWGSFLSCALTLGATGKFGKGSDDLVSSNRMFRLLEKELETALVERDGYRNRVRDLELELAESFMACERATWQMQGLICTDGIMSNNLFDTDDSDDGGDGIGLLSRQRKAARSKLSLPGGGKLTGAARVRGGDGGGGWQWWGGWQQIQHAACRLAKGIQLG